MRTAIGAATAPMNAEGDHRRARIEAAIARARHGAIDRKRLAALRRAAVLARTSSRCGDRHLSRQSLARAAARRDRRRRSRRTCRCGTRISAVPGTVGARKWLAYRGAVCPAPRRAAGGECIVPKTSAGQGLRADSQHLRRRAARRRDARRVRFARPDPARVRDARPDRARRSSRHAPMARFDTADILAAIGARSDLGRRLRSNLQHLASGLPTFRRSSPRRMPRGADVCCSTSIIRLACFRWTSRRSTRTSRSAAATSTCAAGPARVSCTCIRAISTATMRTLDTGWFAKAAPVHLRAARSAALCLGRRRLARVDAGRCCRSTRRAPAACSR